MKFNFKIKRNLMSYVVFLLIIYVYLYNPLLLGMGSIRLLLYVPTLIVLYKHQDWFILFYKTFKTEYLYLVFLFSYVFIRTIMGGELVMVTTYLYAIFEIFLIPAFLLFLVNRMHINNEFSFFKSILRVGGIATCITMLCIIFPTFNEFVRNNFLFLDEDSYLAKNTFRGFGISSSLTSDYGFIQGAIFSLVLFYKNVSRFYIWILPLVFISALLNARTGCIIAIIGLIIFLFNEIKTRLSIVILFIIVLAVVNFEQILILLELPDNTISWINVFFVELEQILNGNISNTTVGVLLGEMFIMPNSKSEWIIGRGYSLFAKYGELGFESDVGFVNQLSYGGLLYVFLLYAFFIYTCKRLFSNKRKLYLIFYIIVFFIVNIKSSYLINCGTFRLMLLIYYYYIFFTSNKLLVKKEFSIK